MKVLKLLVFFLFAIVVVSKAQHKIPVFITVYNNGTTLPGSGKLGVFTTPVHPGFSIGTYHTYKSKEKHDFFQNFRLGFFYHHLSEYGIQLYSETGYRYKFKCGFDVEGMAGAGYLHAIPDLQQFLLKDGAYVKKKSMGRPQVMASAVIGVGYDFEKKFQVPLRLFLQYQFWVQAPFVKSYVPVLPNTALHLGARFFITRNKQK